MCQRQKKSKIFFFDIDDNNSREQIMKPTQEKYKLFNLFIDPFSIYVNPWQTNKNGHLKSRKEKCNNGRIYHRWKKLRMSNANDEKAKEILFAWPILFLFLIQLCTWNIKSSVWLDVRPLWMATTRTRAHAIFHLLF